MHVQTAQLVVGDEATEVLDDAVVPLDVGDRGERRRVGRCPDACRDDAELASPIGDEPPEPQQSRTRLLERREHGRRVLDLRGEELLVRHVGPIRGGHQGAVHVGRDVRRMQRHRVEELELLFDTERPHDATPPSTPESQPRTPIPDPCPDSTIGGWNPPVKPLTDERISASRCPRITRETCLLDPNATRPGIGGTARGTRSGRMSRTPRQPRHTGGSAVQPPERNDDDARSKERFR